jgi:hypothetical protein
MTEVNWQMYARRRFLNDILILVISSRKLIEWQIANKAAK